MDQLTTAVGVKHPSPTPGPFYWVPGATTIWSGNGSIRIAECKSPQLSVEGNAANAHYLAKCSELPRVVRRAEALLRGQGVQPRQIGTLAEQALHDLQCACAELGEGA